MVLTRRDYFMKYGTDRRQRRVPFSRARRQHENKASLAVVAIKEETDKRIDEVADEVAWVGIGQLGKMIALFKKQGVDKAIMAGQVKHVQIFSGAMPDVRMMKMLWNLPRRNTDALIGGVAAEMAKEGIELIDSTYFHAGPPRSAGRTYKTQTRATSSLKISNTACTSPARSPGSTSARRSSSGRKRASRSRQWKARTRRSGVRASSQTAS